MLMMDPGAPVNHHRHLLSPALVNELMEAQIAMAKEHDSGPDATTARRVPADTASVINPLTALVLAVLPISLQELRVARGHQLLQTQVEAAEDTTLSRVKYVPTVSRKATHQET